MSKEWTKEQVNLWNDICSMFANQYSDECHDAIENGEITSISEYESWFEKMEEQNA